MLFAHLKRILKLDRLRLGGPNGAKDEFLLAATAQNLRKLAKSSRRKRRRSLPEAHRRRASRSNQRYAPLMGAFFNTIERIAASRQMLNEGLLSACGRPRAAGPFSTPSPTSDSACTNDRFQSHCSQAGTASIGAHRGHVGELSDRAGTQ